MKYFASAMLVAVAIIHLLPLSGVLGASRLKTLYRLTFTDPSLLVLMQHRAVLFGMLGLGLLVAAFHPPSQAFAFVAGFVSVASFLVIAWSVDDYNRAIQRVVHMDLVALVCLVLGALALTYLRIT
jgi:hypothetical protein